MNLLAQLKKVQVASKSLRLAQSDLKNQVLLRAAELISESQPEIIKANQKDLRALDKKATTAFVDRLTLNSQRLDSIVESLKQVAGLPDSVGEQTESKTLANGLHLRKVRAPLGVILMIFESRPNVAVESFSLAFKAGNCIILRGGRESMNSTGAFYKILHKALKIAGHGLNADCLWGITNPERSITHFLLKQKNSIDVVVPRGGDSLINFVVANSLIPIIKNDRGLCHAYAHEDADLKMASDIMVNGKCQRPGVCNSVETILVHEKIAGQLIPMVYDRMEVSNVQWFVDPKTKKILKNKKNMKSATEKNWNTEYLDFKINCKIVKNLDEALKHISKYGSKHSEAIVTHSHDAAKKFQNEVDAAAVYWNASTRFTDGFEFDLGGELGISTQKLHVRGPVGLRELTSERWIIDGNGQIRK